MRTQPKRRGAANVAEDINQQIMRIAQLCDHSAGQAKQGAEISQDLERMSSKRIGCPK